MENGFLKLVMALALITAISSRSSAVEITINDILNSILSNTETRSRYSIGIIYKEIDNMLSGKSKFFFGIENSIGYELNYNNVTRIFCGGVSRIGFESDFKNNGNRIFIDENFALEGIKKYTFIGSNDGKFKKLTSDSKIFAGHKFRVGFEWHNNFPAGIPIISSTVSFTCTGRTGIEKVINDIAENSNNPNLAF